MNKLRALPLVLILVASVLIVILRDSLSETINTNTQNFSFIVLGDQPYGQDIFDKKYVAKEIRNSNAQFVVHLGDYKNEKDPCSVYFDNIALKFFENFEKPFILTPGDNEWTNCKDVDKRLAIIRKTFFQKHFYEGINELEFQSNIFPKYLKFVENATWALNGIRFVTIHVVGSNNNRPLSGARWEHLNTIYDKIIRTVFSGTMFEKYFPASDLPKGNMKEFIEREEANISWLKYVFRKSTNNKEAAMVIFNQANTFKSTQPHLNSGFQKLNAEARRIARSFQNPILWVQGDTHDFLIDKPYTLGIGLKLPPGIEMNSVSRVVVPGSPVNGYVRIDVDPTGENIFDILAIFPIGEAVKTNVSGRKNN